MHKVDTLGFRGAIFLACVVWFTATASEARQDIRHPDTKRLAAEFVLSEEPSNPDALVEIPDAVLRRAVEEELGKDEDESISRGDMAHLKYLYVDGDIRRLEGLEHALNLVSFYCTCTLGRDGISDLAPLTASDVLTNLRIYGCSLSDVKPLAEIHSLQFLDLTRNNVVDITPLAELGSLESVVLGENAIFSLSAIGDLRALKTLVVSFNYIEDVTPLEDLGSLTYLDIRRNVVTDLSALSELSSIEDLVLIENYISDIRPLIENESISAGAEIDIRYNPLSARALETDIPLLQERGVNVRFDAPESSTDAEVEIVDPEMRTIIQRATRRGDGWPIDVDDMEGVFVLDARGFHVKDIAGIEHAIKLSYVDLAGNSVGDISPLGDLSFLRVLYLDGNEVADLAPLSDLPLYALSLRDTRVRDFAPLANIERLRWVALDGNSISDVPLLPHRLEILHLANNAISDIGSLANLRWLSEVRLGGNAIRSLLPLAGLSNLAYVFLNDKSSQRSRAAQPGTPRRAPSAQQPCSQHRATAPRAAGSGGLARKSALGNVGEHPCARAAPGRHDRLDGPGGAVLSGGGREQRGLRSGSEQRQREWGCVH